MIFPLWARLKRHYQPVITLLIIALNVLWFLWRWLQPPPVQNAVIAHYALIPDHLHLTSLITSMFLHEGWLHLIGNMWFLWVFGPHLEDSIGSARFLLFYLLCGLAASVVQVVFTLGSPIPMLGASGAIAGVMGGFLVSFPRARVTVLIFVLLVFTIDVPASLVLIYWFLIQAANGLFSLRRFTDSGGVAWFAHVGGFIAGILFLRLFPRAQRYFY